MVLFNLLDVRCHLLVLQYTAQYQTILCAPTDPVRDNLHPPTTSIVQAVVHVPPRVRLLDRYARVLIPLPVQRLLQGAVQQATSSWKTTIFQWTLHGKYVF